MFKWIKEWLGLVAYEKNCWHVYVRFTDLGDVNSYRIAKNNDFKENSVRSDTVSYIAHVKAYNHEEAEAKGRDLIIKHREHFYGNKVPVESDFPRVPVEVRRSATMDFVGSTGPAIMGLTLEDLTPPYDYGIEITPEEEEEIIEHVDINYTYNNAYNQLSIVRSDHLPQPEESLIPVGQVRYVVGQGLFIFEGPGWARIGTQPQANGDISVSVQPLYKVDHLKFELGVVEKEDRCRKLVVHK